MCESYTETENKWVQQDDWSTLTVGDQVRVTRDGQMLTGQIVDIYRFNNDPVHVLVVSVPDMTSTSNIDVRLWTLWVPAKPPVAVPTEIGLWVETGKELAISNVWQSHGNGKMISAADPKHDGRAAEHTPFTKLEPVAETAKKVLYRVAAYWEDGMPADMSIEMRGIAKEFGVSHD